MWWSRDVTPRLLTLAPDGGLRSASRSGRFTQQQELSVPRYEGIWAPDPVATLWNIEKGFWSRWKSTAYPVASLYTDWANPVHIFAWLSELSDCCRRGRWKEADHREDGRMLFAATFLHVLPVSLEHNPTLSSLYAVVYPSYQREHSLNSLFLH
jgi:hypothetical protein